MTSAFRGSPAWTLRDELTSVVSTLQSQRDHVLGRAEVNEREVERDRVTARELDRAVRDYEALLASLG